MPHNFITGNETSEVSQYLAIETGLEKRRRGLLKEEVEERIPETHAKYSALWNKSNPVLTLPTEIICLIFIFAQLLNGHVDGGEESGEDKKAVFLMEVIVSHVCQRWRSISLGFPALWTSFRYQPNGYGIQPLQIQRFDCYAERSAALPLRIWFDFISIRIRNDNNMQVLVEKALHHACRWQRFTMYSRNETAMDPFHLFPDLSMPMLEHLTLIPGVNTYAENIDPRRAQMTRNPILKGAEINVPHVGCTRSLFVATFIKHHNSTNRADKEARKPSV